MSNPKPVCDSETMRAFEAEIAQKARMKVEGQKVESIPPPDESMDSTPFGRKLKDMEFWKP